MLQCSPLSWGDGPSSGRWMVFVGIWHVSSHCILPCLNALSRAYCKCHGIHCGCCVTWHKLLCTTIVPSRSLHQQPQQCIVYTEPKLADSANTCFFCDGTPHITCHECKVLHCAFHASILCQLEIYVGLRQFWAANLAAVAAIVAVDDATDNTHPSVLMCRKWYLVPSQCPQNGDGPLRNDDEFRSKLQEELKKTIFGMCTMNPTEACKPSHIDTEADLTFKHVFCNYL